MAIPKVLQERLGKLGYWEFCEWENRFIISNVNQQPHTLYGSLDT